MVCRGDGGRERAGLCFLKGRKEEEGWWMACEGKDVRSGL